MWVCITGGQYNILRFEKTVNRGDMRGKMTNADEKHPKKIILWMV